jgi:VanZ family protein
MTDELHQVLVPGRTATIGDVVIDALGVAGAMLIWRLFMMSR